MDPLTLDSNGGTALIGPCGNAEKGTRLVLAEPNLRALDLHEDGQLEVLDLRGCGAQDYLHLQLNQLPNLREIHLPALSKGAIVHLFSLSMPRTLMVHGVVYELDADWQTDILRLTSEQAPWKGVRLLGHEAKTHDMALRWGWSCPSNLSKPSPVATPSPLPLTVVINPTILPSALHLSGEGEWLITDASPLTQLVIDGPQRVRMNKATALETLSMHTLGVCETQGLEALTEVKGAFARSRQAPSERAPMPLRHGSRKHLTLRGNMKNLKLTDAWDHVQLHAPRLERLTVSWAKHLALYHCDALTDVALPDGLPVDCYGSVPTPLLHQARFFIDEATLKQSLKRLEAGEIDLLEGVLNVLSQRYAPQAAFHSLTTLLHLAKQGMALDALWQCRRTLSAWHRQGGRKRKRPSLRDGDYQRVDTRWGWEFPADRLDEGLNADLQLWALCASESEHAKAFRKTLLKEAMKRNNLGYFVRAATAENAHPALIALMHEVLVSLYGSGQWPQLSLPAMQKGTARYLPRLLKEESLDQAQRQAVLHAIAEMTPWASLPQQLAELLQMYPGPVRALLMTLARQSDDWFQWRLPGFPTSKNIREVQQQFMQLALMPPSAAVQTAVAMGQEVIQEDNDDDMLAFPPVIRHQLRQRQPASGGR
ncbi:hypothetical protein [Vreelandella massiliensis]|uniref:hypothetical protein n=1 Tax=Vreelandella massiliensis TaxID=1816686 RepID=UPI00096A58EB|nr:hypothetical protein [Halomonas massiliensis]